MGEHAFGLGETPFAGQPAGLVQEAAGQQAVGLRQPVVARVGRAQQVRVIAGGVVRRLDEAALRDALVGQRQEPRQVLLHRRDAGRFHLGTQPGDRARLDAERVGTVDPAAGGFLVACGERLGRGEQHAAGQRVERLPHARVVGPQVACREHVGLGRVCAAGEAALLHARIGQVEQTAGLLDQRPLDRGAAWRGRGGGLDAFAFPLQLGGEEVEAGIGRVGTACGVQSARRGTDVLDQQRLLDAPQQLLRRAGEPLAGLCVARVAQQHRPVELDRVLSLRLREATLGQRDARSPEEAGDLGQALRRRVLRAGRGGLADSLDARQGDVLPWTALRQLAETPQQAQRQHEHGERAAGTRGDRWIDAEPGKANRAGGAELRPPGLGLPDRPRAPRCRVDEVAHALRRHGLVEEPEDRAAGDVRSQRELVVAPSRHHDRQVGELCAQPLDQFGCPGARDSHVQEQHAGLGGDEQFRGMQCVVGAPYTLPPVEGVLEDLEQCLVMGEHDHVDRRGTGTVGLRRLSVAVGQSACGRRRGQGHAPVAFGGLRKWCPLGGPGTSQALRADCLTNSGVAGETQVAFWQRDL